MRKMIIARSDGHTKIVPIELFNVFHLIILCLFKIQASLTA